MNLCSRLIALCTAFIVTTDASYSQGKVEVGVHSELRTNPLVRVLIVTRPDPGQINGGASLASASSYVAQSLGDSSRNVRAIGSLPVASAEISAAAVASLREDPNVVLVTRDIPMPPTLFDSVPFIGGDKVHKLGFTGSNETVAVLDTGADVSHPALAGAVVSEACFSTAKSDIYKLTSLCPGGYDVATVEGAAGQCPSSVPFCAHGTHVAGIVAGHSMVYSMKQFEGVAPAAKILPIQVYTLFEDEKLCGSSEKCILSFTSDQLRALEWVFKHRDDFKIAAVNMSLGSGYYDKPCDGASALTEIIERLRAAGIPTVIAAGNDHYPDAINEPACISSAVSVTSTKKDGALDVTYSNVASMVHIAAPGTDILSSVPGSGYAVRSGTSMAAPHVAATFAVLRQEYPSDTVSQLEARLVSGAPMTIDVRTGTKLPRLELTHAVSPSGSTPAISGPTGLVTDTSALAFQLPSSPGGTGSFIVKTDQAQSNLESSLSSNCTLFKCDLKVIGKGIYKLDVSPKASLAPEEKSKLTIDSEFVKGLLEGNGTVFDNRLSGPIGKVFQ